MSENDIALKKISEIVIKDEWEKHFKQKWPEELTLKRMFQVMEAAILKNFQETESNLALKRVAQKTLKPVGINENDDLPFFMLLSTAKQTDLGVDFILKRIARATIENDSDFFIKFGKVLKLRPQPDRIDFVLATMWNKRCGRIPQLSWFTDSALLEILVLITGNKKIKFDQIRKARQRLGLKTKEPKISGVKIVAGGFKFLWVDKSE